MAVHTFATHGDADIMVLHKWKHGLANIMVVHTLANHGFANTMVLHTFANHGLENNMILPKLRVAHIATARLPA